MFTVAMGIGEAGYYTRESGPSGDDYTGLLAIPAGLLLVGVGLTTLWRSGVGGGFHSAVRPSRPAGVGCGLGLYFVLFPLAASYVFTHAARAYVPRPSSVPRTRR